MSPKKRVLPPYHPHYLCDNWLAFIITRKKKKKNLFFFLLYETKSSDVSLTHRQKPISFTPEFGKRPITKSSSYVFTIRSPMNTILYLLKFFKNCHEYFFFVHEIYYDKFTFWHFGILDNKVMQSSATLRYSKFTRERYRLIPWNTMLLPSCHFIQT